MVIVSPSTFSRLAFTVADHNGKYRIYPRINIYMDGTHILPAFITFCFANEANSGLLMTRADFLPTGPKKERKKCDTN